MKKFTKLWQLMVIVLLSSSVVLGQNPKMKNLSKELDKTSDKEVSPYTAGPDANGVKTVNFLETLTPEQQKMLKGAGMLKGNADVDAIKKVLKDSEKSSSNQLQKIMPQEYGKFLPYQIEEPSASKVGFLEEGWGSGDFATNGWTFDPDQGNWGVVATGGNPDQCARLYWSPGTLAYDWSLVSAAFDVTSVSLLSLSFDLFCQSYSFTGAELIDVDVWDGAAWVTIASFNDAASFPFTPNSYDVSAYINSAFQVRFHAYGANTFDFDWWLLDNIKIFETPTTPVLGVTPPSPFTFLYTGIGVSETQTFTLSNIGIGTLEISTVALTGDPEFTLTDVNIYPASLTAGASITVDVTFTPTVVGVNTATLTITDTETDIVTQIAISGEGVPIPGNDLDVNAYPIAGPFPATVTGTTIGAQADCFAEPEVYYSIYLPNCLNDITISYCPTAVNLGIDIGSLYPYIQLDDSCGTTVQFTTNDFNTCTAGTAPYSTYENIVGPATIWIPVSIMDNATGLFETDFEFEIDIIDVSPTSPVCGTTSLGTIVPTTTVQTFAYVAGDTYYWDFSATEGTSYSFSNCGSLEDTYMRIYDDCFVQVAFNDDGANCTNAEAAIDWLCPETGTYYVSLAHWSCEVLTTDYDLAYSSISCNQPLLLATSATTITSATVTWAEGGNALWNLEYGPTGYTLGEGTPVNGIVNTNPFGDPFYIIPGLTSGTIYDWYVQADCGGGDLSFWSGPATFTTVCEAFVPTVSENFETFVPLCWDIAGSGTPLTGPGDLGTGLWAQDDFGNVVGGVNGLSAVINIYVTDLQEEWLTSWKVDLAGGGYQVDFDLAMTAWATTDPGTLGSDDQVQLLVSGDGGTTWTNLMIWDNTSVISNVGEQVVVDISTLTYSEAIFAFWGTNGAVDDAGVDNDFFVDNFQVRIPPQCDEPLALGATNITQTSADLTWTSNSLLSNIEFGSFGFTPTGIPTYSGVTSPFNVSSLTFGTMYSFYVQDDCGVDDGVSIWVGPYTFTTLYPPPANDECLNAELVSNAYPTVVTGTTNGATVDCPGLLDWDAVWYEIELPYAYNLVELDLCLDDALAILTNTGIILTQDCNCDIATVIFSTGEYSIAANCITDLNFEVAGPATVYYPVQTDPKGDFAFDVNVTEVYSIEGTLTYGFGAIPMELDGVTLDDGSKAIVGSTLTDLTGYYQFEFVPAGTYTLGGTTDKPRGGTDVGDINLIIDHVLGTVLMGLQFDAADVALPTGVMDVQDLNGLLDDILGANPVWAIPNYLFSNPTVTVPGTKVVQDMQALSSGDPDGSFIPPAAPAGSVCGNAIPIAFDGSGTVTVLNQTNCGLGNFYEDTDMGFYDNGEDAVYILTVTGDQIVTITLDSKGTTYSGVGVFDDCPDVGTLLGSVGTSSGTAKSIEGLSLVAGTYYIMVDTWASPDCIPDFDLTIEEWVPAYCSGGPTSTADSNVELVNITGEAATAISHIGCPGVLGAEDLTAQSVTVTIGSGYSIDVTFGSCGGYYGGAGEVWIDWNQDFVFDVGESVGTWSGTPPSLQTLNFTVPAGAVTGTTRMRVMQQEGGAIPLNPCGSYTWGSVMDFSVVVQ